MPLLHSPQRRLARKRQVWQRSVIHCHIARRGDVYAFLPVILVREHTGNAAVHALCGACRSDPSVARHVCSTSMLAMANTHRRGCMTPLKGGQ